MITEYRNISITHPDEMKPIEVEGYADSEIALWEEKYPTKKLACILLTLEGDEVSIKARDKQWIRRIRRITGYLSEVDNFSDHKKAELDARKTHVGRLDK